MRAGGACRSEAGRVSVLNAAEALLFWAWAPGLRAHVTTFEFASIFSMQTCVAGSEQHGGACYPSRAENIMERGA